MKDDSCNICDVYCDCIGRGLFAKKSPVYPQSPSHTYANTLHAQLTFGVKPELQQRCTICLYARYNVVWKPRVCMRPVFGARETAAYVCVLEHVVWIKDDCHSQESEREECSFAPTDRPCVTRTRDREEIQTKERRFAWSRTAKKWARWLFHPRQNRLKHSPGHINTHVHTHTHCHTHSEQPMILRKMSQIALRTWKN